MGAQEPRKYVFLDGISIAYTDSGGSGPVLICLHAVGHGARDFEDLGRRLSPRYRVIALDFPNQGNSSADSQPASGTRYSKLLSYFIERLDLQIRDFAGRLQVTELPLLSDIRICILSV